MPLKQVEFRISDENENSSASRYDRPVLRFAHAYGNETRCGKTFSLWKIGW